MRGRRLIRLALAAPLLSACGGTTDPAPAETPSLTLSPQGVINNGPPGTRMTVGAEVRGLGAAATIEWVSRAPNVVVVESTADGGRTAVLRFDQKQTALVVVTARGTGVLVDTLYVSILTSLTAP